jgi:hypothetical protein
MNPPIITFSPVPTKARVLMFAACPGVALGLGDGFGDGDGEAEGLGLGLGLALGDGDGDGEALGLGDGDGSAMPVNVTVLSVDVDAAFGLLAASSATPALIEAMTVPFDVIPLTATL